MLTNGHATGRDVDNQLPMGSSVHESTRLPYQNLPSSIPGMFDEIVGAQIDSRYKYPMPSPCNDTRHAKFSSNIA